MSFLDAPSEGAIYSEASSRNDQTRKLLFIFCNDLSDAKREDVYTLLKYRYF